MTQTHETFTQHTTTTQHTTYTPQHTTQHETAVSAQHTSPTHQQQPTQHHGEAPPHAVLPPPPPFVFIGISPKELKEWVEHFLETLRNAMHSIVHERGHEHEGTGLLIAEVPTHPAYPVYAGEQQQQVALAE